MLSANLLSKRRYLRVDNSHGGLLRLSFVNLRRALGRKILHVAEYVSGETFEPIKPWSVIIDENGNVKGFLEGNHKATR